MAIAFLRTIILYIFLIFALRLMGKKQIGELQPSDLAVTILISELAAIPMQETGIPLVSGIVPIFTLVVCDIVLSVFVLKSRRLRRFLTGKPSILIRNGVIDQNEMKKQGFNIDDLMEELRLTGFLSIDEVEFAIVETNGKLSVFPNCKNQPVTAEMLNLKPVDRGFPTTVISDGLVAPHALKSIGKDLTWLQNTIKSKGYEADDIFLMIVDKNSKSIIIPKEKK